MKKLDEISLEFHADFFEQCGMHGRDPYNYIGLFSGIDSGALLKFWFEMHPVSQLSAKVES